MGVLLGIDHGGTTTTCVVVSEGGGIIGRASTPMNRQTPRAGWVEHDANGFVDGSLASAHHALEQAGLDWKDVRAVGIANQGETSIGWDSRTGRTVAPALSWQDKRTSSRCDDLRNGGFDDMVQRISGLSIDPYFSASKYSLLAASTDEARAARERGTLRLGGTDAYLIDRLTGGAAHATDASSVSRTALMNLDSRDWSDELLALWDVPRTALPAIQPTTSHFGEITHADVPVSGIPIMANIVDAHASLFMHDMWTPNAIKATLGTGAFIETSVGTKPIRSDAGLTPFVGWDRAGDARYVLEGSVFDVGAAIDWLVDMGLVDSAALTSDVANLAIDSAGLTFVPAFSGLAAPYWDSDARAAVYGMSLRTRPEHVVRALLEGLARSVAEVVLMLAEASNHEEPIIKADGGPSQNPFLMQLLADFVGFPVVVTQEPDITGLGAACLAGLSAGTFTQDDLMNMAPATVSYVPASNTATRESKRREWQDAARKLVTR